MNIKHPSASRSQLLPNLIMGAVEWITFPELGINALRARVDTGAHISALHADEQELFVQDGKLWIRFIVHKNLRKMKQHWICQAPVVTEKQIKNSAGKSEQRWTIRTPVKLGPNVWDIDITLTNRKKMRYHFLLGRQAMHNRILVNPSHAYLHGRPRSSATNK